MSKYIWLAVTMDKYEFPLVIEDSSQKLAERLGTTRRSVMRRCNNSKQTKGEFKIRKVLNTDEW